MGKERKRAELKIYKGKHFQRRHKKKKILFIIFIQFYMKKGFTGRQDDEPNGNKLGEREATAKPLHLVNLAARAILMELILQQTLCILLRHLFKTKPTSETIGDNTKRLGRGGDDAMCSLFKREEPNT